MHSVTVHSAAPWPYSEFTLCLVAFLADGNYLGSEMLHSSFIFSAIVFGRNKQNDECGAMYMCLSSNVRVVGVCVCVCGGGG